MTKNKKKPSQGWQNRIISTRKVKPETLVANPKNWRVHPKYQREALKAVLDEVGWVQQVIVNKTTGLIVDGHLRVSVALERNEEKIPVDYVELTEKEEEIILATLDPLAAMADTNQEMLNELWASVEEDNKRLATLMKINDDIEIESDSKAAREARRSLADAFLVPPFTILDARQGYWQNRKRTWISLGLESHLGRQDRLVFTASHQPVRVHERKKAIEKLLGETMVWSEFSERYPEEIKLAGTSIFDPVICEIAYRWFCNKGGSIMDPFAGGSVRGVVAGMLGYHYTGIDLRGEQVEENRRQWDRINSSGGLQGLDDQEDNQPEITKVQTINGYMIKRDDTYRVAGVNGGKVRTCWALSKGAKGLVTAGSRASPQVNIVAHIGKKLAIPVRVHIPEGELSPELTEAARAGAEVIQHKAAYNNVIISRARKDAKASGYTEIPFGMECQEAVEQTRRQVSNIPSTVKRIIMPVGSGMSLAGVLHGIKDNNLDIEVIGIKVGADPIKRLEKYAPEGWKNMVRLIDSEQDYHEPARITEWQGLNLDPHYEAKCIPHIEPGDLLWVVGCRQTENRAEQPTTPPTWIHGDSRNMDALTNEGFDLIFSCPPYADLEVYSDDPADISTMEYKAFLKVYREIISKSVKKLRNNRFAVWVVGEIRDKKGKYRNFVGDTIHAFEKAGMDYYNEGILVHPVGSMAMKAASMLRTSRKIAKGHQNVLVFKKGNPAPITPELIGHAVASSFGNERKLLSMCHKVLVFSKGDPKMAAEEFGEPPAVDKLGEDD